MSLDNELATIDSTINWEAVRLKYNPQRPCKACGKSLDSIQSHRLTCSNACRQRLFRIRSAARKQLEQATDVATPATPTTNILGE